VSLVAFAFVRDRTMQSIVVEYDRQPATLLPAVRGVGQVAGTWGT